MKRTKHVLLTMSVIAAGAWQPNRFVNFGNAQAGAGEAVLGVTPYLADQGDVAAVDVIGVTIVEAGGAFAVGAKLASSAQGLAVTASSGQEVAGEAMDAALAMGDLVRVILRR